MSLLSSGLRRITVQYRSLPRAWVWTILVVAAFLPYVQLLRLPLISDDYAILFQLVRLGPFGMWSGPHTAGGQFIRPLVSLSFYLNYMLGGFNPLGYHLLNWILHFLDAVLVGVLTYKILKQTKVAYIAGFLFAVWPHHTDAVTWVSGRTDVLAALFVLLCLVSFLSFRESGKTSYLWGSYLLFVGALLSKESAIVLPLLILIFDKTGGREKGLADRVGPTIPFWGLLFAYFGMRYALFDSFVGGYGAATHVSLNLRAILTQLGLQVYRLFVPAVAREEFTLYMAVALAPLILVAGYVLCRRSEVFRLPYRECCLAALVSLLSVITMAGATFEPGINGERFAYLASCFSVMALSVVLAQLQKNLRGGFLVSVSVIGIAAVSLYGQNRLWGEAGDEITADLKALHPYVRQDGPILIAAVVDTINGVYVWPSGLGQAEYLEAPPFKGPLLPVFRIIGYEPGDQVSAWVHGNVVTLQVVPSENHRGLPLGLYLSPNAPGAVLSKSSGIVSKVSFHLPAVVIGETSQKPMKPRLLLLYGGQARELR